MSQKSLVIPFFLLIALSILFLGHYVAYFSLVHFFGIAAPQHRAVLATVLFLLALSFFASSILVHWTDNLFSRAYYFISSLWLGAGLTLVTALAFAWAAWAASLILVRDPNKVWFGAGALALAGIYSASGIWNAYHPRIVNLTVRIKNLPPAWQGKKLVQLSDVHLGQLLGARFLERIVAIVNAQAPDLVLITGDLFDGTDGQLEELVAPLNTLQAPRGIFFVTGNHETYLGVERSYAALQSTPARILADERVVIDGLQVIGISYPERGQALNLGEKIARLPGFDPHRPSILLYHSPTHIAEAKAAGINLQLAGHVHQGQIFPLQPITRLIYGRYYHGLHSEGNYTLYATSGAGTWGPTMRTGNHPEIVVIHLS
jgi:hypothetical protein